MADSNQVKLRAKDTLHVSSVQADPIRPKQEFSTDAGTAKQLLDRGLVDRVTGTKSAPATRTQAAPKPTAKVAPPARTQAAPAPRTQAARTPGSKGGGRR